MAKDFGSREMPGLRKSHSVVKSVLMSATAKKKSTESGRVIRSSGTKERSFREIASRVVSHADINPVEASATGNRKSMEPGRVIRSSGTKDFRSRAILPRTISHCIVKYVLISASAKKKSVESGRVNNWAVVYVNGDITNPLVIVSHALSIFPFSFTKIGV